MTVGEARQTSGVYVSMCVCVCVLINMFLLHSSASQMCFYSLFIVFGAATVLLPRADQPINSLLFGSDLRSAQQAVYNYLSRTSIIVSLISICSLAIIANMFGALAQIHQIYDNELKKVIKKL